MCERCRADLSREPLPPDLDRIVPVNLTEIRELLWLLWRHRGQWLTTERVIAGVYIGKDAPLSVENCIAVQVHRLRRRLPRQYRIESRPYSGYRLIAS